MVKRVMALAVLLVVARAAPAAAQQYPPTDNILTVSATIRCAGQTVTVEARTFLPVDRGRRL
jgi:hypothetical protein